MTAFRTPLFVIVIRNTQRRFRACKLDICCLMSKDLGSSGLLGTTGEQVVSERVHRTSLMSSHTLQTLLRARTPIVIESRSALSQASTSQQRPPEPSKCPMGTLRACPPQKDHILRVSCAGLKVNFLRSRSAPLRLAPVPSVLAGHHKRVLRVALQQRRCYRTPKIMSPQIRVLR